MTDTLLKVKPLIDNFTMPLQAHQGDAGFDCFYQRDEVIAIMPGERVLVPLDFSLEIPEGYEVQVRPRSGLAKKHGITVLNSPGTIDSSYTGPCAAIMINLNFEVDSFGNVKESEPYVIMPGDRVCQMVVAQVPKVSLSLTDEISETQRGSGGFGSTGR